MTWIVLEGGCRWGGALYLVVDHHVDGAVGGVGGQVGQVESLVDDALTGEGRVAMQQDGHHLGEPIRRQLQ